MDIESTQQAVIAYVQANATVEAAKIAASAAREATRVNIAAASIAALGGLGAIIAAYINTSPARRRHDNERHGYRLLIDGLLEAFARSIDQAETDRQFFQLEYRNEGYGVQYRTPTFKLPSQLGEEHWERHALIGGGFAREVSVFRSALQNYQIWQNSHEKVFVPDLDFDQQFEWEGGDHFSPLPGVDHRTTEFSYDFRHLRHRLEAMSRAARRLQGHTRTISEVARFRIARLVKRTFFKPTAIQ